MSTIQEKIAVMQAYADGKTIESKSKKDKSERGWCVVVPSWNWYECDYRVAEDMDEKAANLYWTTAWQLPISATSVENKTCVTKGIRAVIDAVHRGEIQ